MVKSSVMEQKVSIQKWTKPMQPEFSKLSKRPWRWHVMIKKRQHRSRLDIPPQTRKGCEIITSHLTKEKAALSCMFLTSGCSQTNSVIQKYIPDVDVKQCVNALTSCAACFSCSTYYWLILFMYVGYRKPLFQPKLHKTINILQTYNCHCCGTWPGK